MEFPLSSSAEPSSPFAAHVSSLRDRTDDRHGLALERTRRNTQSTSITDSALPPFRNESDDESTGDLGELSEDPHVGVNDRNRNIGPGFQKDRAWTDSRMPEQLDRAGPVRAVPVGLLAEVQVIRSKLQQASYTIGGQDFSRLFRLLDRDKSGSMTETELLHSVRHTLHIPSGRVSAEATRRLFRYLDADRDGRIDLGELFRFLRAGPPDESSGALLQCQPEHPRTQDDSESPHSAHVAEIEPSESSIVIEGHDDDRLSAEIERLEAEVARTVYQSRLHGM